MSKGREAGLLSSPEMSTLSHAATRLWSVCGVRGLALNTAAAEICGEAMSGEQNT
jgi:hypothetical protein